MAPARERTAAEFRAVVPAPPEGMDRYATISVMTTNVDEATFVRRLTPSARSG